MESKYTIAIYVGEQRTLLTKLGVVSVKTNQQANGIPIADLELSMLQGTRQTFSENPDVARCQSGQRISVEVGETQKEVLFEGIITEHALSLSRENAVLKLQLTHSLVQLDTVIHSQIFADMTDKQIINNLCPSGIATINHHVAMEIKHEQKVQFRCTDWQMLRRCLDANVAWLVASPAGVQIINPTLNAAPDHQILRDNGLLLDQAHWTFSVIDQPETLSFATWDIDEQKLISRQANSPSIGSQALDANAMNTVNSTAWVVNYSTPQPANETALWANNVLLNLQLSRAQGEFELEGSTDYQPGQTLEVTGFGERFDGAGLITSVSHMLTPSHWKSRVTIGRKGLVPALDPLLPITGMHVGTVVDHNKNDPKNYYRIRVHVSALHEDKMKNQLWARFSMPYASKDSGLYCYPEVGDEVVLSFFENNPCYPVIIGALHNPKNKPAITYDKDNPQKGWVIKRDGVTFKQLFDVKAKTVTFSSGEKSLLTLSEDKGISIKGDKGIDITSSKAVTIQSKKIDLIK
ncbi:phage baseplate assembly protein V [Shewanella sp. YLB-07]|uniref:phage baseplate assembly protein V n=1 Tax=Shewanella sp. YLB-07 TaxID=2601268 RepID=UPI00128B97EF|nr:phage baseplate assembly protein V [Shewanella sp. YLB-07]MPY24383.1 hypothetical protein [Shewanella sp. YLB-07]